MKRRLVAIAMMVGAFTASAASADVLLFDIDANPGAWSAAIATYTPSTCYDLDVDPDYGVTGFPGPVTSAGAGPVGAGTLPGDIEIDSELDGPGGPGRGPGEDGLVGVGPAAGFGNPSNALLANFFVDALKVSLTTAKKAIEFNALTLLGSDTIDILVTDSTGAQTMFANVSVAAGKNLGLASNGIEDIVSISIHDAGGGAEGVQGFGKTYTGFVIPEPGSVGLLGLLALGMVVRRRR